MDTKLEVVVVPVSDVDRALHFYKTLGWRLDADFAGDNGFRAVQLTPPGSHTSIHFGTGLTPATPGSAQGLYLVVPDIEAAKAELTGRGAAVSEIFHRVPGNPQQFAGPDPDRRSYSSYATFSDPDGNTWLLQEVTTRLPGRVSATSATFDSVEELAEAMRRAEKAHGEFEKQLGHRDEDWPSWYAQYMAQQQAGL